MFGTDFDVMLYVRDVERSVGFYRDVLGFHSKGWWSDEAEAFVDDWQSAGEPGYAELSAGPLKVSLHASETPVEPRGCFFHLAVDDVDAYHGRVAEKGAGASAPRDEPWGWRMFSVEDPDGHSWGFYTA